MTHANDRVSQLREIQDECRDLFARKNADYGDAFATYGAVGVIVRIGDKLRRFTTVTANSVALVDSESVEDTLMDLHNYAAMALMLLRENRPCKKSSE